MLPLQRVLGLILKPMLLLAGCLVCAHSSKDVPVQEVTALVGEPAYLPCDITPAKEGDTVHLILWFREDRNGTSASIYSVDARDRDLTYAEKWSDDEAFSTRATFLQDKQPAMLGIDHIREDEAGIYRCRVEFQVGQTRNSKVNLSVIVPPHKIIILNEHGTVLSSSVGPYVEGDDMKLHCDVHGGKPPPRVSWYKNGRPTSSGGGVMRRQRDGTIRSELIVKGLRRRDVQSEFTCNATNNDRSHPLSASVRVNMNLRPLTVNIEGANEPLSSEKRYDLVCTTSGSRPLANVTWFLESQMLTHSKDTTTSDGNTTTSVLSFTASKSDAGKRLFCRAQNPIMNSQAIEDVWLLEVQYVPETTIRLGTSLDPNAIKEGSDVYFDCLIQAEPPVYKVEWRHQGKSLSHNITQGVIISNQSLVLQGVNRRHAGNYTCVGHNTEGDGESRPFYLNVMFAPTCKPNQNKYHGVAKQEKASVTCQVDANPPEVDFHWTFNNSAESVNLEQKHVKSQGITSTASYTPMIEMDYGTLLCWARNRIGHQQTPCAYHIIPAGRPDVVHNCTTSNTSKHSFVVRCSPGFDGGLSQSFLLEVRESSSQEVKANMSESQPHFNVNNLEAGSLYQVFVYAYNDKGRSEPMVIQAGTLSPPEKQLTSEEQPRSRLRLTPMLSVMIGVVVALVIVAVIVMIVLRIQHSQVDEHHQTKSQQQHQCTGTGGIAMPGIQRELRFRDCPSLMSDEKSLEASPFGKLDSVGGADCGEADEKNPDIIPQQITFLRSSADEDLSEYLRKRRLVSTIETSPSRSLLERSAALAATRSRANYVGYCTMARGSMPLREMPTSIKFNHKNQQQQTMASEMYESSGMCTLPRQHYHHHVPAMQSSSVALSMAHPPAVMYTSGNCNNVRTGSVSLLRSTAPGVLCDPPLPAPPPPPPACYVTNIPHNLPPVIMDSSPILITKRESSV
ncbi:protein turtle [Trichogramma pretiosum]|uniref:protein turtle n=1 Tax=Trichogramma pretiosum TaxID=7493 RepID=UPI000C71BA26|nr:protein turtle [Trichogramma pretiosum]